VRAAEAQWHGCLCYGRLYLYLLLLQVVVVVDDGGVSGSVDESMQNASPSNAIFCERCVSRDKNEGPPGVK